MIRDEQGSMSAFLAMLFLVFLLLISVCVEGIYMYTARGKAMGIYMSGLSHTKGNYQKELADMYHIYAMDPRYHKKIETDFSDRMKESLDQNGDPFRFQTGSTKISDILDLSAQKGEVLKYQIRQQMQYEAAGDILKNLTKKIKAGEDQKNELSGIKDQIQKEEEEAEETENEKTLTSEPVKKDPRKGFMKLLKEGSVPLIMGEKKVSDLPINIVYGKKDTTKQSAWNFMNRKDVEKEAVLLAASILGVTGFPPAVAVAKNLLLLALAYGESVIDVRNLADGKKIPAVKTSSDWQLSFAGLATLNCKRKPVKQGMSYEDYLLLLLISQKDKRQKYFRMMDLMEQNIRRKVSDFKLDQCISSYKITQNLKLKKLGFGGMILPFATYTDLKMYRYVTY